MFRADAQEDDMQREQLESAPTAAEAWPDQIYDLLKQHGVRQVGLVPDAGHARLIKRCLADNDMKVVSLTTEEEGIALAFGAWLGGEKSVLLMQSSGVGNCINLLSLTAGCRFPLLTLVSMRGDFGEGNAWQFAMGQATEPVLKAMGVVVLRCDAPEDVIPTVTAAITMVYQAGQAVAVLLGQRLIGAKKF